MRQASDPPAKDSGELGADGQADVYGIMNDLEMLESMLEDLDEFGYASREAVDLALITAQKNAGDREADAMASRLEEMLAAMDEFEVASRDDIVSKMAYLDNEADAIDAGETTSEFTE
jgi:hypothetical protein